MTTQEINTTRLDLVSGKGTRQMVDAGRRIIAIGRSSRGNGFVVTAPMQPPADFAEAVAEVDSAPPVAAWTDDVEDEVMGAEICEAPYNW